MAVEERQEGAPVRWPRDVYEIFAQRLEDLPVEEFHVAVLDSQHRLERDITITRGLLNSSLVHPREVFKPLILMNAAGWICAHNHPSADTTPCQEDRVLTSRLRQGADLLGISLLDHLILTDERCYSFADQGWPGT